MGEIGKKDQIIRLIDLMKKLGEKKDLENFLFYFMSQPLKRASKILKKLPIDEEFYRSSRYALVGDAKSLFMFGCIKQIEKAAISLHEDSDLIRGGEGETKGEDDQTIIESITESQDFWLRKLIEILVNLICFEKTNQNNAYRIYLSAENLDLFSGKQSDFKEFYGFESANLNSSIGTYKKRIDQDLEVLGLKNIWFLSSNKVKNGKVVDVSPTIFSSIRGRLKEALKIANDDQKIALGSTYHTVFSMLSSSIHPEIGCPVTDIGFKTIKSNFTFISLLCQHILDQICLLMGIDEPQSLKNILGGDSNAPKLMDKRRQVLHVGDLVFASGKLAEIIETKVSDYGYTSYKVRFLNQSFLPDQPEDWFPSEDIFVLVKKSEVRGYCEKSFSQLPEAKLNKLSLDKIMRQPDSFLFEMVKDYLILIDKDKLLLPMYIQENKIKLK